MDIVREREIKRALHYICSKDLVNLLAPFCGIFFSRLFFMYGLIFNEKTIKAKRIFIQKAASYFILDRLSSDVISKEDNKYMILKKDVAFDTVEAHMIELETFVHKFSDVQDFICEFSQKFEIEKKNFEGALAMNIKGASSLFDRTLENLYYLEKDNKE